MTGTKGEYENEFKHERGEVRLLPRHAGFFGCR